jgi:DNA-binding GntR family transcriptional regulator
MREKTPLKQKAYELISEKIINCEYPPNSFLNEQMLSDELKISRTPIRDALIRLQQNNLIKIFPKKGIVVTGVTPEVISSVYEIRGLIEPYIVLTYSDKIDLEKLQMLHKEIEKDLENGPVETTFDDQFHKVITDSCPNKYIQDSIYSANIQDRRIRVISGASATRLGESHREHLRLIEKLCDKEFNEAAKLLSQHLENAKLVALNTMIDKWR